MTTTLVVALTGLVVVAAWRVRTLGRDVASLRHRMVVQADAEWEALWNEVLPALAEHVVGHHAIDAPLRGFWNDVLRLHEQHTGAVETRLRAIESAAGHSAVGQSQLAGRVGAIEQWVRLRVAETREVGQ